MKEVKFSKNNKIDVFFKFNIINKVFSSYLKKKFGEPPDQRAASASP